MLIAKETIPIPIESPIRLGKIFSGGNSGFGNLMKYFLITIIKLRKKNEKKRI